MSRPIRIQYPGATYHIMSRGNCGNKIYKDNKDYEGFLELLSEVLERYNILCYSYCLMSNHYHLFLETLDPNLSIAMRHLNGRYTQKFNIRYKQYGHLFQGRFKSVLVEKELYKYELIRYIVLNLVRAGLVRFPEEWEWSSYNEIIGKIKTQSFCLDTSKVLDFYDEDKKQARKIYLENISLKMDDNFAKNIEKKVLLGGDLFIEKIKSHFKKQSSQKEISKVERYAFRPALKEIFKDKGMTKKKRNNLIKKAHLNYAYNLSEISREIGLYYTTISKVVNKK